MRGLIGLKKVSQIYKYIVVEQTFVFKKQGFIINILYIFKIYPYSKYMKRYLIYLLVCVTGVSYAQDQLFKKDNSKVEVKILEINQNEIKYKLFTYQDGPTITISKKDVALIIYQNGVHEVLNAVTEVPEATPSTTMIVYNNYRGTRINQDSLDKVAFDDLVSNKHLISFNMLEPLNGSFSINYLSEFANNYLNIYVPVSVGFANPYFTQLTNNLFSGGSNYNTNSKTFSVSNYKFTSKNIEAGLGIHFQTSGKRAVTHFIGPYVGMAQFTGTYDEVTYINNGGYTYQNTTTNRSFTMNRLYVLLDNGFLFRATKNFNIILLAGVGYHVDAYKTNDPTKATNFNTTQLPVNAFKLGLSFGYRF
jgi:hypothetical protein